eukprot:gnl/Ergobibamus_cyprinoides/170.p1 GENE.gnl/Ergobibamus_cyprinoides/170~~gnl/Ergobibamus_cyprinoides/170.p1  ORF type:complete len:225 (+),score=70.66 gnl/Ergobibamus_cyprinoides/170:28-675(+)
MSGPYVTGTSVLAMKYAGGVLFAADTLLSYGRMSRFKNSPRLHPVGDRTVIGFGGDQADFQSLHEMIEEEVISDECLADGFRLSAYELHTLLARILYNRRCKVDPLWNYLVVGGLDQQGTPFLGQVDLFGTKFTGDYLATGYGGDFALPLIRKEWRPEMSLEDATLLMKKCMKVLSYRDCQTINSIQLATASAEGITVSEPFSLEQDWSVAGYKQ